MTLQEGLGVLVSKNQRRINNESSSWYNPLRDSIRHAANNFTIVNDKESYESAKKVFKQELEKYSEAVKTLEEIDLN
ncbi:MAG TPA: hypothetical protein VI423_06810 [Paenisporosarcina sp.]|nr:hypothetical protein [Paenisporosarcina sp.]